jgi:hypothetical protein
MRRIALQPAEMTHTNRGRKVGCTRGIITAGTLEPALKGKRPRRPRGARLNRVQASDHQDREQQPNCRKREDQGFDQGLPSLPTGTSWPENCPDLPHRPPRLARVISAHRLPPLHDAPPWAK